MQPCWLRRAARNRHGPRHRADIMKMAWRAADDAATAAAEGAAARGVPRRTNAVGATSGVPRPRPADAHHPTPPFSTFHRSRAAPGPDAVRTAPNSTKKRPTTSSDGHESRRRRHESRRRREGVWSISTQLRATDTRARVLGNLISGRTSLKRVNTTTQMHHKRPRPLIRVARRPSPSIIKKMRVVTSPRRPRAAATT